MPRKKPRVKPDYNWHHKIPKVHGGSGHLSSGNMVEVRVDYHRAFHLLFDTKPVSDIARILNDTWIDPTWVLIAVKKEKPPCN